MLEQDAGVPCPDTSGAVWTISVVSSTNATQPAVQALLAGQIESTRSTRGNLYHSVVRTAHVPSRVPNARAVAGSH